MLLLWNCFDLISCRGNTVRLEKGKTYVIDLQSTEMDSYLFLYGPTGTKLAEDDDSGGALNSRIVFTPAETADYTASASTFGVAPPGGASYVLTVRER